MHYKLLGFSQRDSARYFAFERTQQGSASAAFTVVADLALARKFRIPLQDLPSLCSRLLEAGPADAPEASLVLTDADLQVHAAANLAAASVDQAKRELRSRRGALAAAARTAKNQPHADSADGLQAPLPPVEAGSP